MSLSAKADTLSALLTLLYVMSRPPCCVAQVDAVRSSRQHSESADVYNHVIQIAILVVCLCHFLVMFNPAAVAAERVYCDWRNAHKQRHLGIANQSATSPPNANPNPGWVARIALRTLLVAFCFLIASTIPGVSVQRVYDPCATECVG